MRGGVSLGFDARCSTITATTIADPSAAISARPPFTVRFAKLADAE